MTNMSRTADILPYLSNDRDLRLQSILRLQEVSLYRRICKLFNTVAQGTVISSRIVIIMNYN